MINTWPGGIRKAMYPLDHEQWNAGNYPGTRQMCVLCDRPTGRCEDDMINDEYGNPLCEPCASTPPEEPK